MDALTLSVEKLSWHPDPAQQPILKEISTFFKTGGFYGILGPNGSGKTSFIRHLLRFLEINEGTIQLEGKDLEGYARKRLATFLSFVPQNVNTALDFSVYEVVAMGRTPYQKRFEGLSNKDKEIIDYALQITKSKYLSERPFHLLSGGEAQRVLVARAIAQDTKYLILDEPISHLDIRYQLELMETLKRLNEEENKTIIAILHDLNLSAAYCKKLVLMKEGAIYAQGSVDEVLTKEHLKSVYDIEFEVWKKEKLRMYIPVIMNR